MRNIILITFAIFSLVSYCDGFETDTHEAINEHIAGNTFSGFTLGTYLNDQLGQQKGIEEKINSHEIWWWLKKGGLYEDDGRRSCNHFHDPVSNQGFPGILFGLYCNGNSSLIWAQKPKAVQDKKVYEDYAQKLLPSAVGYSAGLGLSVRAGRIG